MPVKAIGSRPAFTKGGDILVYVGAALNHHVFSQMAELMYERAAANHGKVVDNHLAGHLCGIRHNHVVADFTVVRDMRVCHNEATRANGGLAS